MAGMYAWSHTANTTVPTMGTGVVAAWSYWAPLTWGYGKAWTKGHAEALRSLAAFSLLVVADLTLTPPPEELAKTVLVLPVLDDNTVYRTKDYQRIAAAILHTWRVLWAVTGLPQDRAALHTGVSTKDDAPATELGSDAGALPKTALTVIATGDIAAMCAIAQFSEAVLERSLANGTDELAPLRDATRASLSALHGLLGAWWMRSSDKTLNGLATALFEANSRVISVAPRQRAPVPDDGPLPSPPSQPIPLPLPADPDPPRGNGSALLLLAAAYFLLQGV